MNIYNILLNVQSDRLIFEFNCYNHFDVFKTFILSSKNLFNFRFILNFIFIKFVNLFDRFISFTQKFDQFKKSTLRKTLSFRSNNFLFFFF